MFEGKTKENINLDLLTNFFWQTKHYSRFCEILSWNWGISFDYWLDFPFFLEIFASMVHKRSNRCFLGDLSFWTIISTISHGAKSRDFQYSVHS